MRWKSLKFVLSAGVALASCSVTAGTEAEYQALRNWCASKPAFKNDIAGWVRSARFDSLHWQHYCDGSLIVNRLRLVFKPNERVHILKDLVGGTTYVIDRVADSHPLKPEAYALRGEGKLIVKQYPGAEADLRNALRLDARHHQALVHLSTLYMETSRRDEAAKIVKWGLETWPTSRPLRKRAVELKVDLPSVVKEPLPEKAAEDSTVEAPPESAGAKAKLTNESQGNDDGSQEQVDKGCRFCPPEEIQKRWRDSFGERLEQ